MPDSTTGIVALGGYNGDGADLDRLLALIPDIDSSNSSGSIAGGGFLDEMSPVAANQLRAEILAIQDAGSTAGEGFRVGSKTVSAGEATANQADIVTGLDNLTVADCIVKIIRGGNNVIGDAVLSEPTPGTLRVASGASTYDMTAGDVIHYYAE